MLKKLLDLIWTGDRKNYTMTVTPEDVKYIQEIIEKDPIPFDEGYEDWVKENPPA